MLGPGGRIVEPRSESTVLNAAIAELSSTIPLTSARSEARTTITEVIARLQQLRNQVESGYHRNPRSEAKELSRAIGALYSFSDTLMKKPHATNEYKPLVLVIRLLEELRDQVEAGYRRNPHGGFDAGKVVGRIGTDVHDIRYTHATNGEDFEHEFSGEVEVFAVLRNGKKELLLSHVRGLPLWDEFPD